MSQPKSGRHKQHLKELYRTIPKAYYIH